MAIERPTQQGLLDSLQENHARFQKLINHLSDEGQQIAITPEGWSFKDFLSHMSHWKAAQLKLIVAYTHDQRSHPLRLKVTKPMRRHATWNISEFSQHFLALALISFRSN